MTGATKSPRRSTARRSTTRRFALAVVAVIALFAATSCKPRPPQRDRPVVFVHGYVAFGQGQDCAAKFASLASSLGADGFTGDLVGVQFYDSDTNCDANLDDYGNISNSTSWRSLSKAYSHFIYDTYTSHGITVDMVGHSMGGLIMRGAVMGASRGESGFSPPLLVEDAVTLGAPFEGAAWYSVGCLWGQCSQLKPGASDLNWLRQDPNPQGAEGTEWTAVGSDSDDVVPVASALAISVPDERKVRYSSLEHGDFLTNDTAKARILLALAEANA